MSLFCSFLKLRSDFAYILSLPNLIPSSNHQLIHPSETFVYPKCDDFRRALSILQGIPKPRLVLHVTASFHSTDSIEFQVTLFIILMQIILIQLSELAKNRVGPYLSYSTLGILMIWRRNYIETRSLSSYRDIVTSWRG